MTDIAAILACYRSGQIDEAAMVEICNTWPEVRQALDASSPTAKPVELVAADGCAPPIAATINDDDHKLSAFMRSQIDQLVLDMAGHVGEQIYDVLKRNGLAMPTEVAATCMMTIASRQILEQAIDQCSRAAEDDCRAAVVLMWVSMQSVKTQAALHAALAWEPEPAHG